MIKELKLHNFKCFKDICIPQNRLNIYSGLNSMGKSTIIQSMLLLKQSLKDQYTPHYCILNGDYINIGTGRDLLCEYAEDEEIRISMIDDRDDNLHDVIIKYSDNSDTLDIFRFSPIISEYFYSYDQFEYIAAERSSPKAIYPKSSYDVEILTHLGIHGEYAVHYLLNNQDKTIGWDSCDGNATTIKEAVQYWLNDISPNVNLEIMDIENTDYTRLGYYYTENIRSNTFRPTNIGFGVSYVLPVIIALIKAKSGSIVIIENPEAHLHPMGQRKIGELIAKAAEAGIIVHIETHSDHVLNGIRISVKKKLIKPEYVNILFFKIIKNSKDYIHSYDNPHINEYGKLDCWPEGFFDEWDKALDEIL
ncbi:MAG: DUF3696 domain-containing protein [Ruminococcus sp.]|uniref:AAA family ATPase n=1 Tax=Ruminococcus sp. TaxID=41978 RepID=UPI0025E21889|nr:DUF3696 domain-containing protein [Ruminococcus sp.]MCR5541117.1 DUF3696 domain-containing protein [Ruminococcus sp.]